MRKIKFFSILAVMTLSMVMSVSSFKKSNIYMMISENVEALTCFDGIRYDYNEGSCGVLFRCYHNGEYMAFCGITKGTMEAYIDAFYGIVQKVRWCCESCPSSSYCD